MVNKEAAQLLEQELAAFRREPYADLVGRVSEGSLNFERAGPSGRKYQLEIQFFWDDRPGGDIRVAGSIDDGGWRAFVPLNRGFIKSADGYFVDEDP
jgi:hypothetical protein